MEEKNLPAKADALLTEVINKDPLVLASISFVPYFGSTIATFFTAKWLQIYQERTEALFTRFGEHLSTLDERTVRQDFFDSPEGNDLLIKATEQSTKTRNEEKRDLIARILCGAAIDYEHDNHSPEDYLSLISDLTVGELKVARFIHETRPEPHHETWNAWEEEACDSIGIDKPDLHLALSRLGSTGLLQAVPVVENEATNATWLYAPKFGEGYPYRVTPSFEKLMAFLSLSV